MNFGKTIKKLAKDFNLVLRIQKTQDAFKPNLCLGASGVKSINKTEQNLGLKCNFSLINNQGERFFYVVPKTNLGHLKEITEPEERKKISVELPLRNVKNNAFDLPCNVEKEISEPIGRIISKKAENMIRIRKRKMRKHRFRKFAKKHRFEFAKIKQKLSLEKEFNFQTGLKAILKEGGAFSAEEQMNKVLEKVNWTTPVTKVRGRLAPKWVINEHLEDVKFKETLKERLEYCEKFMK